METPSPHFSSFHFTQEQQRCSREAPHNLLPFIHFANQPFPNLPLVNANFNTFKQEQCVSHQGVMRRRTNKVEDCLPIV